MEYTFYIDEANKTINFLFPRNDELRATLKNMDFNSRYNPEYKQWIVPVNKWTKNRILEVVKKYKFKQVAPPKQDEVQFSYEMPEVDYAYLKGLCDAKGFVYTPRDYQLQALGYAREKGNLIIGDDVGLGKTFEAIMYAETSNAFPCLVVVPASVKYNWQEKWLEITDNKREVSVIESSSKKNNWDAEVVIINYDIIGKKQGKGTTVKFQELLEIPWKMQIYDEAHFVKEKKAQRSAAAKAITRKRKDAVIVALTGTAIMSKPVELWNLLKLIKRSDLIAFDWFQYIRRYCGGYRGKFGWVTDGATNTLELNKRLRETCYIRREKRDVLDELPEVTKQVIQIPIPISYKREILRATNDFIEWVRENKGDEKAEKAMEAEHLVAISALKKLAIESKLKGLEQYLKDWLPSGKKLLIFGVHREPLEYLANKFKCDLIAGGVSSKKKQEIVKKWQQDDNVFLFANIESAGTGVDGLQLVCSNMLIVELPWRPSDLEQVIGRLDRSGQEEAVTVSFMLSFDTIDNEMWEMLNEKERVTEAVNKGIDVVKQGSGLRAVVNKILKKFGSKEK